MSARPGVINRKLCSYIHYNSEIQLLGLIYNIVQQTTPIEKFLHEPPITQLIHLWRGLRLASDQ